jgi:hypothetical protein
MTFLLFELRVELDGLDNDYHHDDNDYTDTHKEADLPFGEGVLGHRFNCRVGDSGDTCLFTAASVNDCSSMDPIFPCLWLPSVRTT